MEHVVVSVHQQSFSSPCLLHAQPHVFIHWYCVLEEW